MPSSATCILLNGKNAACPMHIGVASRKKIRPFQVNQIISAEIPCTDEDPLLHKTVTTNMIHGPCGVLNPTSPCMQNGICSKRYPKQYISETQTDHYTGDEVQVKAVAYWKKLSMGTASPLCCALLSAFMQEVRCSHQCRILPICQSNKVYLQICVQK